MAIDVVGLDLSLTSTGVAIRFPYGTIETARIRTVGKKDDDWPLRSNRIRAITTGITNIVRPGALVMVEAPSYASVGGAQHDRSGLWWRTYTALEDRNCIIVPVAPSQRAKYATGKGAGKDAGKDNVLAATVKRYPQIDITGNDIADAVILMAMGLRIIGQPLETNLPKTHLDALTKLRVPILD